MFARSFFCKGILRSFALMLLANGVFIGNVQAASAPANGLTSIQEQTREGVAVPRFMVDAAWPRIPETLLLGQVAGIAVDANDSVWAVHRPHSLTETDTGLARNPPTALCCQAAPPVVHFTNNGTYLGGFGGPDSAPTIDGITQWPQSLHGISVDAEGMLWFGGNGNDDHVVLKYTPDGKFLRAFGRRGQTNGNADPALLGNPSDVNSVDGRIYVSDGYTNRRLIGFNEGADRAFSIWGAYGEPPAQRIRQGAFDQSQATHQAEGAPDPHARELGSIVHCSVPSGDGQLYLCDRVNNRAQVFDIQSDGSLRFVSDLVIEPKTGGLGTVTDIALSPDKKYLYVADMMNGRIWILLRETQEVLGHIGRIGRQAGQFTWLHSIATDSQGNIYTAEVGTGRRVQKFVLTGIR